MSPGNTWALGTAGGLGRRRRGDIARGEAGRERPPERSGQGPQAAMRSPSLFSVMGTLWKGRSPEVKA